MAEQSKNTPNANLMELINKAPIPYDREHALSILNDLKTKISEIEEFSQFSNDLKSNSKLLDLLLGIFGNSPFLTALIIRNPEHLLRALYNNPEELLSKLGLELEEQLNTANNMNEAMQHLRHYKKKAGLLTALADLSEIWDVPEIIRAITITADTPLQSCVRYLFRQASLKGEITPNDPARPEEDSGYIILAMGKQGGFELNYSSDIDIIVFFDTQKITLRKDLDPSSYFVKLTRNMVKMMQEITADGYVYRVDLRLRPDPGATQIALSTNAAYSYYESFGQNWERAAMIKARPVAGDINAGQKLIKDLAPFIWRKYLDYAAIDDIHAMKRQVNAHKGHGKIAIVGHNLKLGRGGIREIEFFTQTQQLIAGGRQPELRTIQTLETLQGLAHNKWIKECARDDLSRSYKFLRTIEHRIQMIADEQTHSLPNTPEGMLRVSNFSGYKNTQEFSDAVKQELETVQHYYAGLFEDDPSLTSACGNLVFVGDSPDPETLQTFEKLGFKDPQATLQIVKNWHYGRYASTRSERARERLTEFQPILLEALSKTDQPDQALNTFDKFLKDLPAGVQLFSMLSSNPNLLRLIADIMGTAPRLAQILSQRTRVLDAVLDPGFFGVLPEDNELIKIIEDEFETCQDYQDTLDRARSVGQEQSFLTGVRLLSGIITSEQAAKGYSQLADILIQKLQAKVESEIVEQHGSFKNGDVAILAMGKLGGNEMTATSDLDLILIYDYDKDQLESDGQKPLSPTQYYSRYTQRLISALSAPTAEGELYEVDLRLRPSGRSGPVATQIESFIDYQMNKAWVWEHLALTRARCISGSQNLQGTINKTIKDVLSKKRDQKKLASEVLEMRDRIEAEKGTDNLWDIKLSRGGQVDLEFICQYLQLNYAHSHPEIINTNTAQSFHNIRTTDIIPAEMAEQLHEATLFYNRLIQIIRLCTKSGLEANSASEGLKNLLAKTTKTSSFDELTEKLNQTQSEIRAMQAKIISI